MTIREVLNKAAHFLNQSDTSRLDAALLLAHAMNISRETLYMKLSDQLDKAYWDKFDILLKRRQSGEPVAWITGEKAFWNIVLHVGPGVLCPRPDSEILVETALGIMDKSESGHHLHDCCCGPGTIALALASERPQWIISASDISEEAQRYFRHNNAALVNNNVVFTRSNLLESIEGRYNIIVCNPPYLTHAETMERQNLGWREPPLALDGGVNDGLDIIRRFIPQAAKRLTPGGFLLLEADPLQIHTIWEILRRNFFVDIRVRQDLAGRDRVIYGQYMEGI